MSVINRECFKDRETREASNDCVTKQEILELSPKYKGKSCGSFRKFAKQKYSHKIDKPVWSCSSSIMTLLEFNSNVIKSS